MKQRPIPPSKIKWIYGVRKGGLANGFMHKIKLFKIKAGLNVEVTNSHAVNRLVTLSSFKLCGRNAIVRALKWKLHFEPYTFMWYYAGKVVLGCG